jgi:predicted dehydrogenase
LQEVRRAIEAGRIGRPVFAAAHYGDYLPDWHPWEDYRLSYAARADLGGGVILTLCHPLDYLRWLLGEATVASASAGRLGDLEVDVDDTAQLTLEFASGALGAVHLDYLQRPARHNLEVVGTRGTVRWDNADGAVELWGAAAQTWERIPAPEGFERNDLFLEEMRHFIQVVRGEAQPAAGLEDGVRAVELAVEALASARGRVRSARRQGWIE